MRQIRAVIRARMETRITRTATHLIAAIARGGLRLAAYERRGRCSMHIARILRLAVSGVVVILGTLIHNPVRVHAEAPFQTTPTAFSGRATAVTGKVLGIPITLVDTGTVAAEGGALEAHLLCYPGGPNCTVGLPDLTNGALGLDVLNATVVAQGNKSHARASVADLTLNAAGQSVSATFLQARATAQCNNGQASVLADSELAELVVNGQTIAVSGAANQRVDLPNLGFVVINEQTPTANGGAGDVTVSALHIKIPGPVVPGTDTDTDLFIAQAHADITCGQLSCPADKDFVTGGGWVDPRRNFAVAGGIKNNSFWGHLLFNDHAGMKVKGTGVTAYTHIAGTSTTSRHIEGTCEINGSPGGTYQVDVDDQNEPGAGHDKFALSLNGQPVVLPGTVLSGGNIQLHTCK
jgi:hypothetical protein